MAGRKIVPGLEARTGFGFRNAYFLSCCQRTYHPVRDGCLRLVLSDAKYRQGVVAFARPSLSDVSEEYPHNSFSYQDISVISFNSTWRINRSCFHLMSPI